MAAPMRSWMIQSCFHRLLLRQIACRLENWPKSYTSVAGSQMAELAPGSSKEKEAKIHLDTQLDESLTSNSLKHKHHPGHLVLNTVSLPQQLLDATSVILEKYPLKELSRKADKLANYLWGRHPPSTDDQVSKLATQIYQELLEKKEAAKNTDPVNRDEVLKILRQKLYHWQPVKFDAYKCLLYLTAHLAHNYSVILQCFTEISKRVPEFHPTSVYNLGSGLGSAIWAANRVWGSQIHEYYCVDQSQDMNTVARLLLQGGDSQKQMGIPGVIFRQFAPSLGKNAFDVVVSAYTLMEQPGRQERIEMVDDLWQTTSDFLILVENGTSAGFSLINEARDHLLQVSNDGQDNNLRGHVFAPCPHDSACAKFAEKKQPCFSQVSYSSISQNKTRAPKCNARYSYIIMRKGKREGKSWPRVIQETVNASKHTHCHLCCSDTKIRHMVFTAKKQGQHVYKCSRYTVWGDQFPVTFSAEGE